MNFVAWQMLTGDRAKYAGLVLAIAFSTFLMSHQMSIFVGLLNRTQSQIRDIADARIWVMDPKTEYLDEVRALSNQDLYRVRGVKGVQWAVPLFKGNARLKGNDGQFRNTILMGLDDATLVGLPREFLAGDWRACNTRIPLPSIRSAFAVFFRDKPTRPTASSISEIRRLISEQWSKVSPPFVNLPVVYTRYSEAVSMVGQEPRQLSFVLCESKPGITPEELCSRIAAATGLKAETAEQFGWETIWYYIQNTGIPINFGITITDRVAGGCAGFRPDFFSVHSGESEVFRRTEGDRRNYYPDYSDDFSAGRNRAAYRICPGNFHDGRLF